MHPRYTVAAALSAALLALAVPPHADASAPPNALTIDSVGRLAEGGSILLSGTYRCGGPALTGPVMIGSTLVQGGERQSIGGTIGAVCDGRSHRWANVERAPESGEGTRFGAGAARVEGTLLRLESVSGLPLPQVLVAEERAITLVSEATD
ncbi:DUF6299 family protein [Streptomyces palmae]|uniref:DUF6299 domain-containing protein n=1 Tax=Streptomyces palmae TaxID=1701085 RepID=A0A4Z0H9V3_9ACTN|nr:DUF6299 family protein [Streptomyces palmae]TGB07227.1 hypothetical protein E4099_17330 [Streptomyces palmae]